MKTLNTGSPFQFLAQRPLASDAIMSWIRTYEQYWHYNRPGKLANILFVIQVTCSALMMVISGTLGLSPLVYIAGIAFAFCAERLAGGRVAKHWSVLALIASVLINVSMIVYFLVQVF